MAVNKFSASFARLIATRSLARFHPWILAGLTVLYIVTFPLLQSPILVSVPVVVAGWFYYRRGGILSSVLAVLLNLLLIDSFTGPLNGNTLFALSNGFLIGHTFATVFSIFIGFLREIFENLFRLENRLQARERFMALSNIIIKKISESRRSDRLFDEVANHLTNLFVADYGYISRWDHVRERTFLIASTVPSESFSLNIELKPEEARITDHVLQSGQALLIEDIRKSPYLVSPPNRTKAPYDARSAICLPLVTSEYRFGTAVLVYKSPRQYTSEDKVYAEQVGSQIALALWTMRQDEISQQQLNETRTLMRIGQALGETERVGLNSVLQLIVDSARKLIPQAEKAVIHLVNQNDNSLVPQAASGFDSNEMDTPNLKMHVGNGAAGQVLRDGITINIANVDTDPRFLQTTLLPAYHSLLVAPVQTAGRQLGTISVESESIGAFSDHEAELLKSLGAQAAIAIENTRLFETTSHSLEELNALYRINQRLAASLDTDVLMKEVVDLLQQSFHYYHVQVYLIESEQHDSVLRQGSGDIGTQLINMGHRLLAGEGIVGHVAYTRKPFVTNDVDKVVFFVRNPLLPGTKSELAVPIKLDGEVFGVLDIQQSPPHRLSERDLQIATAVAEQLAVALQKANLYSNLQTALQHEQTMRSQLVQSERLATVGRLLASVSHELNNPLQAIQNALFLLKDEESLSPQGHQDLDVILAETEHMASLIGRLRATYRPPQAEDFQDIQLNHIVEGIHALTATYMRHRNIVFEFHPEPELPVMPGIPDQIRQVLLNLFMNAIEAMRTEGRLTVHTQNLPGQGHILLTVSDTGPGIAPEILPNIFDPFVTGKDTGTGLGMTIARDIVLQHRGEIQAENCTQGGAVFKVWLPVKKQE